MEDGYKGYSTNYQDLNTDVYKLELWNIVKETLGLLGYDIQSAKICDQMVISKSMGSYQNINYLRLCFELNILEAFRRLEAAATLGNEKKDP